jgi:Uri superfamily endonuclease
MRARPKEIGNAVDFGDQGGAYALALELPNPTMISAGAFGSHTLPAGAYIYGGSAMGPGGISARVRRHLRGTKRLHWHIDQLTTQPNIVAIGGFSDIGECEIVRRVVERLDAWQPVKGFGSSDCQCCESHFLQLSKLGNWPMLLADIGATTIWRRPTFDFPK